ncbi:spermidine acetyltransferase [Clostridium botulinum]|uniref:GNAT family N-acetyltransferase n=1 Tax=Clostridium botulinum TaxID=1491 RepID=UPI000174E8C7|nr:GNAT family N-acetyltransferase [Clostridium botulinum]ACD52876.1 spermine/spermidine acetyltransferase [Clostridium botulinum E3 str. Alaska E43]AJF28943.1 spermidine acetyltransferase [Clostridium botulinum]AJF32004.1 spermidine acetyltransferase [Clostridium botulinum]MBY6789928.1 GNAT family N-acetyltransferase [Clostridium botulinum]MBY6818186.1 GNAT family N-acetyltransferase [Clostridium botulinum]
MEILRINESDIEECANIFVEAFNAEPWNDNWTIESAHRRLQDIYKSPNFVGVKYTENNEIFGALFGNCEEWFEGRQFNIKEVFVSKKIQGKNIGSKLINSAENEVKKLGVDFIFLSTQNNNLKNFYLKHDFEEASSLCIMFKRIRNK